MPEITIRGKGLITKIDKTDSRYTTEIPLDGELVCVTDGDSAGLVVGDGTSTVDECKSIGGGSGDSYTFEYDETYPDDPVWNVTEGCAERFENNSASFFSVSFCGDTLFSFQKIGSCVGWYQTESSAEYNLNEFGIAFNSDSQRFTVQGVPETPEGIPDDFTLTLYK